MHNYLSFEYNVLNSINRIKQVNLSGGGLWEPSHPLEQWNRNFRGFPGPNDCLAPPLRQIPDYAPETKLHNTERQNFMMIRIWF